MGILEYEVQMLQELVEEDGLVVAAKGIGLENLLLQLIKIYSEPSHLVIVIGTSADEENFTMTQLLEKKTPVNKMPRVINYDTGTAERAKVYASGGVLFITSRILVVDMLVERIPIESITGIIVYDAHKIMDAHQEKFILRLFRLKNKSGFIKGLTQTSTVFPHGFGKVDRTMRSLFVKKIFLWPRFRSEIVDSLEKRAKPDVLEIRFSLSKLMEEIQFAVIDLISLCLKEIIKSSNLSLYCDPEEMTVENAISPTFGRFIRKKLEPIWNQLPPPTRRQVNDIKLLRQILFSLTEDDCVTFYNLIQSIRQSVRQDSTISDWLYWKPTDTLFDGAKRRVHLKKEETPSSTENAVSSGAQDELYDLETNPKWNSFHEIIQDIKVEVAGASDLVNVLVITREESTGKKLTEVLEDGPEKFLKTLYVRSKMALNEEFDPLVQITEGVKGVKRQLRTANINDANKSLSQFLNQYEAINVDEEMEENSTTSQQQQKGFDIHYHSSQDGYLKLEECLRQKRPRFVVMYDPDMESIRRLEVYQATYASPERIKVYFLMFDGSAEEQRYLTALRKEKEAFEFLIKEKSTMVVPAERDGRCGFHPDLIRGGEEGAMVEGPEAGSSRHGGLSRNQIICQKVIVDMREFRSELPSLLHKRGIDIEPVTIEIGDYVLSPEICVERKSISDLIGSLNSGRLYSQCSVMTRHYKKTILLIEFDADKPFNLKGRGFTGFGFRNAKKPGDTTMEIMPKLILLTITFPKLRCIWSPSPHYTAEVFEHLKVNREQPDLKRIIETSEQQLPAERNPDKYDLKAKEFLLSLPGVNLFNVYRIMNKVNCIFDLLKLSEKELAELLESERSAKVLFEALHGKLVTVVGNDKLKAENAVKASKRFKRKR